MRADSFDRPLRVAFLIPALNVGGAERMVLRTASGVDRQRFDPTIVAFAPGNGRLEPMIRECGVRLVAAGASGTPRVQLPLAVLHWLWANPQDVLLTYMFHANQAGRVAKALGLVPAVICSERVAGWESPLRIWLNRHTERLADALTTNSEAGRHFWSTTLRVPPSRVHVIYNGVDLDEFSPAAGRLPAGAGVKLGVLAQLRPENGHRWLIDALAALHARTPHWSCTLAGDGPEEGSLKQLIADRGLGDHVALTGHCPDPPRFLRSLDLLVHPALTAGMPNAVLEAMACALPVVATAVGGTPELIDDGRNGFLVPPGDAALTADRVQQLIDSSQQRLEFGAAARRTAVGAFSVLRSVQATERLILEVVGKTGRT